MKTPCAFEAAFENEAPAIYFFISSTSEMLFRFRVLLFAKGNLKLKVY